MYGSTGRVSKVVPGVFLALIIAFGQPTSYCEGEREDSKTSVPPPPWARVSRQQTEYAAKAGLPVARELDIGRGAKLKMVLIPPGEFMMGSKRSSDALAKRFCGTRPRFFGDEHPWHRVRLTRAFYMGIHEVTNEQYRRFRPAHSSKEYDGQSLNGDKQPVVEVCARSALDFCEWLQEKTGERVLLPTEAQWEYACRAGCEGVYWWGDNEAEAGKYANVADRTAKRKWPYWTIFNTDDGHTVSSPVGSFKANGFGLYDMIGNVWEWCLDGYDAGFYAHSPLCDPSQATFYEPVRRDLPRRYYAGDVMRGGSWMSCAWIARCSNRAKGASGASSHPHTGFRIVVFPSSGPIPRDNSTAEASRQ